MFASHRFKKSLGVPGLCLPLPKIKPGQDKPLKDRILKAESESCTVEVSEKISKGNKAGLIKKYVRPARELSFTFSKPSPKYIFDEKMCPWFFRLLS
ncbi:MAG: hypothetical protein HC913_06265 [Microscillaceae bacterium]|nr:hypothetical protein [Microscillaceae bacterium]